MSTIRLRQVATVARDLEAVHEDLVAVLGLGTAYRDPGVGKFGLHNVVLPVGDTFFEVVSPREEGTTAGRFLERQGGDAGYMVILQTSENTDRFRERMAKLGVRVVWTGDHDDIRGTHLHPADIGGAILSVDEVDPPESWRWGGPDWTRNIRTDVVTEVAAAEMTARDPHAMAVRWAEVLEREAVPGAGRDVWRVALDRGDLRFVAMSEGSREGVTAFDLSCPDPEVALATARERGLEVEGGTVQVAGITARLVVDAG